MMDRQLRRYYLTATGIALAATAVSLAWRDPKVTAGVVAGAVAGVVPFATWHLIVGHAGERSGRGRSLVVALVLAKYGILAGAMWVLFSFHLANEYGFGAGLVATSLAVLGAVGSATRKD